MRCRLHQDRQGTRRTEVTARPATQPDPARPGHSSAPMNLHPHRELRSRRTNRPRPPHLRQPGFFMPAIPIPALSHLPKVSSISAKSFRLRKVSFRAMPATASVAAFPFRPALSHLRKVCGFPAKSSRLRKVSSTILYLPTGPVPDSHTEDAGRNGILPPPSEFRYMPTCLRVLSRQPCPGFPSEGRCRRKWLFTVTFQNQPNQPELSACP